MLHLNFFGAPEIYQDEQPPLHFRTRKAQALLIYLAVTQRSWSRDSLATLFWPETDDITARKNLRDILPTLRKQLDDYLHIEDEIIGLNMRKPYKCDVINFCAVLERPLQTVETDALVTTLALYRGEFLEGYASSKISADFEMWVSRERERLHQLALMGFTTLCRRQQDSGEIDAALTTNRQLLKLVPWDEAAHRRQMLLLAQSGQQAAALAHFEVCRQILADELDVGPSAEMVALYTQIQTGAFNELPAQNAVLLSVSSADRQLPTDRPLANKATIPNNLSNSLAVFVGRQHELTSIRERLATSTCRLLTIVGPGGMGKSSLALAAGQQLLAASSTDFPDGIFWVTLAEISAASAEHNEQTAEENQFTPETILRAIAAELSLRAEIRLSSSQQLHTYLRPRRLLLILDNFEHLLAGVQALVTLLAQAPQLKILVTSRARLNLRGEHLLILDKLSLPTVTQRGSLHPSWITATQTRAPIMDEAWQESEAMAMFVQRAQQLDPDFTINAETIGPVVAICRLVEGLPLGIELATSMLPLLSCDELVAELTEGLDFLQANTYDLPKEQRTLQAVFERSWRLLSPQEQLLLAKLSIFPSTFDRNAAEAIANATLPMLMRLKNHSLVSMIVDKRYAMHSTIREFASVKLQMGKTDPLAIEEHYVSYYLTLLAQYKDHIHSPKWQVAKLALLTDIDNIRKALRIAVRINMWLKIEAAFTVFNNFFADQGWFEEAADFCRIASAHLTLRLPSTQQTEQPTLNVLLGRLLVLQGWYETRVGQAASAHVAFERSLAVLRRTIADIEADTPADTALIVEVKDTLGSCLTLFGTSKHWEGTSAAALELLQEAIPLCRKPSNKVFLFHGLAMVLHRLGNYPQAKIHAEAGLHLAQQQGDKRFIAFMMTELGRIKQSVGDYATAQTLFQACYELRSDLDDQTGSVFTLVDLGEIARRQGDHRLSHTYLQRGMALAEKVEFVAAHSQLLWALGNLALDQGDYRAARAYFLKSQNSTGFHPLIVGLPTLGWVYIGLKEFDEAETYFQEVVQAAWSTKAYRNLLEGLGGLIVLLSIAGQLESPDEQLALIERYPATTHETQERIRNMYEQRSRLEISGRAYRPSASLQQSVKEILAEIALHDHYA